jgi:hypothetical protein
MYSKEGTIPDLIVAAHNGDQDTIEMLLANGASVHVLGVKTRYAQKLSPA